MNEVECIRLCEEALTGKLKNYKIRINSSAIIECIFEECRVAVVDRLEVLKQVTNGTCKN
jgi:histidyl-tRNA synthetase